MGMRGRGKSLSLSLFVTFKNKPLKVARYFGENHMTYSLLLGGLKLLSSLVVSLWEVSPNTTLMKILFSSVRRLSSPPSEAEMWINPLHAYGASPLGGFMRSYIIRGMSVY